MGSSKICEFFSNQTIFITGGTGFLGKVLIEKLLRECWDLEKIFIMVRPKKGKSPEQRFDEIFDFPCFDLLKTKNINFLDKVSLIYGDCEKPFLGLANDDLKFLIEKTTVVIHAAANVKFDQSLKEAACYIKATKDLLEIAKEMKKLKAFAYISTFFSNCCHSHINEDFYNPPMNAETLITLVDGLDENILIGITPNLLGDFPNTYVFTKCISEDLVKRFAYDIPVAIIRPAIITASAKEPVPGWIDNFYGISGVVAGAALGVIRSLHVKVDNYALIVPVDFVSNCILAAICQISQEKRVIIYNYAGFKESLITWREFIKLVEPYCWAAASTKVIWYYGLRIRENKFWHRTCVFLTHTVPSYIVDFVFLCMGRAPMAVQNMRRLNKLLQLLEYFGMNTWTFDDDNIIKLWERMNKEDREIFDFDMRSIDKEECSKVGVFGGRRFLLKDTNDTFPQGKRKLQILFVAHYALVAFLSFLFFKFVMLILKLMYNQLIN